MKVNILGVKVDSISFSDGLAQSRDYLFSRGHYIVTPNPEFLVYANTHPQFKEILNNADLAIPDGVGLIWAARLLGNPLKQRIAGSDFGEAIVKQASSIGESVFFLGGRGDVAKRAAEHLERKYPGLVVAGWHSGDPSQSGDQESLSKIGSNHIGLLLVAYGHPKQELWIERNLPKLNVGVAMGVGGSFDFWSGDVPRAPRWVRQVGLEWLFRLLRQPWRLKRQLALLRFISLVIAERFQ